MEVKKIEKSLKEIVEDNNDRINEIENQINFLTAELDKVKSAKVVGKLEIKE